MKLPSKSRAVKGQKPSRKPTSKPSRAVNVLPFVKPTSGKGEAVAAELSKEWELFRQNAWKQEQERQERSDAEALQDKLQGMEALTPAEIQAGLREEIEELWGSLLDHLDETEEGYAGASKDDFGEVYYAAADLFELVRMRNLYIRQQKK